MEKRYNLRTKFSVPPGPSQKKQSSIDQIVDMSTCGACIITSTQHEPGKRIMFELNINDAKEKITKEATVQWVRPYHSRFRVGIKFV